MDKIGGYRGGGGRMREEDYSRWLDAPSASLNLLSCTSMSSRDRNQHPSLLSAEPAVGRPLTN